MDQKIDWLIHLVANGACDECGEVETDFCPICAMPTPTGWNAMDTWISKWYFCRRRRLDESSILWG